MIVTKQIEWDMGHRVLNHHSKCQHPHGHRYKLHVSLEGNLVEKEGDSSLGMVIDFGDIKQIVTTHIHDVLDHGFMVWEKDAILVDFYHKNSQMKHIIVPFTPTAENIAAWIFDRLQPLFVDTFGTGLALKSVKLWETPSSYVVYDKQS